MSLELYSGNGTESGSDHYLGFGLRVSGQET